MLFIKKNVLFFFTLESLRMVVFTFFIYLFFTMPSNHRPSVQLHPLHSHGQPLSIPLFRGGMNYKDASMTSMFYWPAASRYSVHIAGIHDLAGSKGLLCLLYNRYKCRIFIRTGRFSLKSHFPPF